MSFKVLFSHVTNLNTFACQWLFTLPHSTAWDRGMSVVSVSETCTERGEHLPPVLRWCAVVDPFCTASLSFPLLNECVLQWSNLSNPLWWSAVVLLLLCMYSPLHFHVHYLALAVCEPPAVHCLAWFDLHPRHPSMNGRKRRMEELAGFVLDRSWIRQVIQTLAMLNGECESVGDYTTSFIHL